MQIKNLPISKYVIARLKILALSMLIFSATTCIHLSAYSQGTWTALTNHTSGVCAGPPILLSDGSVFVKTLLGGPGSYGNVCEKLTPDNNGSYINGSWSTVASMLNTRIDYSSQLLKDGRLYIAGGEYGTGGSSVEIYDPLINAWTSTASPGFNGAISDANSEIFSDGRVLQAAVGDNSGTGCKVYDPATNSFGTTITTLHSGDEATWLKLPDGSILMIDYLANTSERYIPSLNQWIADSNVPVSLHDAAGEIGASFLLPDGRAFFIGATSHTALYTPSGNNNPGSWVAGPDLPNSTGQQDAGGAMMMNGNILFAAAPLAGGGEYIGPTYFYEYNYLNNSFIRVSAPGGGTQINSGSNQGYFSCLPNGQILWGNFQVSDQYYIYTPSGSPITAGKPTITNVTEDSCGKYTLTGTLFGGISEGAGYGDDAQSFSNYPIVKLTSGSNVYYARTFNWSSRNVQTGAQPSTTQCLLPSYLPAGTYSMTVSVNGISSDPVSLNFTCSGSSTCQAPSNVSASNITPNGVSVSWSAVPNSSSYYVYYKKQGDPTWILAADSLHKTSITIGALSAYTTYNVAVWVVCNSGSNLSSPIMIFTTAPDASTCVAPSNIVVSNITNSGATISWSTIPNSAYYYIYYKKQSDANYTYVGSLNMPGTTLSGLTANTYYVADIYVSCNSGTFPFSRVYFTTSGGLPVSLVDFYGALSNDHAFLNWKTATEFNNKGFEVQKSLNGQTFTDIGFVAGHGNSSLVHNYNYTDVKVLSGSNYYRLKQIDFDGRVNYSSIIKLDYTKFDWTVLGNPVSNNSWVQVQMDKAANVMVQVVGMNGNVIRTINKGKIASGTYSIPLRLNNVSSGIYVVRLIVDGKNYSKQIFK
ncbi:MAG: fibronectin type III domain-containing protein [Bacteroidota bacterium]|nr:fibronectin type III domain-containing protein [Bacteroidota bacterium]